MLRNIILIAAVITIPIVVYVAVQYSKLQEVTFAQAEAIATSGMEGDQAPKVLVISKIKSLDNGQGKLICQDQGGAVFTAEFTGQQLEQPLSVGQTVRFVGHVHSGAQAYFHATQVYEE